MAKNDDFTSQLIKSLNKEYLTAFSDAIGKKELNWSR